MRIVRLALFLLIFSSFAKGQLKTSPPSITSLSSLSDRVGAVLTIDGSKFGPAQENSNVMFNTTTATVISWSATSVVTLVPEDLKPGVVTITINTPLGPSNPKLFVVTSIPTATANEVSGNSSSLGVSSPLGATIEKVLVGSTINHHKGVVFARPEGSMSTPTPTSQVVTQVLTPAPPISVQDCLVGSFGQALRPDPAAVGSITAGSNNLTVVYGYSNGIFDSFKNGCGIAVNNAGPMSSATPPQAGSTISSFGNDGNGQTLLTCATECGYDTSMPANQAWGIQISGCTGEAGQYNGTWPSSSFPTTTTASFTKTWSGVPDAMGCSFTSLFGYPAGESGSTIYHYRVVSIDDSNGYSKASAIIDITNGNATLDWANYNVIQFDPTRYSWYAIYRAIGDGAYSFVGATPVNAFVDHGFSNIGVPPFLPNQPPSSAGNQTLHSTVASGGGTANLVLTDVASATVTGSSSYHDDSSLINSCLNIAANETFANGLDNSGCIIPAGVFELEGPTLLDHNTKSYGTYVQLLGGLVFLSRPWFLNRSNLSIICEGAGSGTSSFQDFTTCPLVFGKNVPLGIVSKGNQIHYSGLGTPYGVHGYPFWIEGSGMWVEQSSFSTTYDSGTSRMPPAFVVGANSFGSSGRATFDRVNASSNGYGSHAVGFYLWPYSQNGDANISANFSLAFGNILFEGPGSANSPTGEQGINIAVEAESTCNGCSMVDFDNRLIAPGNPGRFSLYGVTVTGQFADAYTASVFHAFDANQTSSLTDVSGNDGIPLATCGPDSTLYVNLPVCGTFFVNNFSGNALPVPNGSGTIDSGTQHSISNETFILRPSQTGAQDLAQFLLGMPVPARLQSLGADATGSLPAAAYCMEIAGVDGLGVSFFGNPVTGAGTTYASNEICQTAPAGGRIYLTDNGGEDFSLYTNVLLFYGTSGPGSENQYIITPAPANYPNWNYQFASTSGSTPGTPKTVLNGLAASTYIGNTALCLACTKVPNSYGSNLVPVVIGTHAWDKTSKVDILGTTKSSAFATNTNCSSTASPADCGSAAAGSVIVAPGATTVVVNTTAVTAGSQIILTFDSSLGTRLGVTCSTSFVQGFVSSRTAGSSFTIASVQSSSNPACYNYAILN